jgi:hypothetical protein
VPHSTFGAEAREAGLAPQPSKLHSPLTLKVWRVEARSVGLFASSLPPHSVKNIEPNTKLKKPFMDFICWTPDTRLPKSPRSEAMSVAIACCRGG